ncbi:MAG: VanZ like family [Bacteroidota bacterium]
MRRSSVPKIPRWVWLSAGAAWCLVVIYFSLLAPDRLPELFVSIKDLILHFVAYSVAAFLLTMGSRSPRGPWKPAAVSFVLGVGLEILQPIVAVGRHFSFADMVANTVGLIFGMLLALRIGKRIFIP